MHQNKGRCPDAARGKRVIVKLRNGRVCGVDPVGNALPTGWASQTTRWTLTDSPFDVIEWEIAK